MKFSGFMRVLVEIVLETALVGALDEILDYIWISRF